jgi:uncharacterized phage-associated protein
MAVAFQYDFDSALAAIVFFSSRKPDALDKYKLCKLIFLADKFHLVRYARPITGDRNCAMEYGPVPSVTLDLLNDLISENYKDERVRKMADFLAVDRRYQYPRINPKQKIEFEDSLSHSDIQALEETLKKHGDKTFDELKSLTHEMPAYRKAWGAGESRNPAMMYEDLFTEDGDAMSGVLEEMIENDELRQAFGFSQI